VPVLHRPLDEVDLVQETPGRRAGLPSGRTGRARATVPRFWPAGRKQAATGLEERMKKQLAVTAIAMMLLAPAYAQDDQLKKVMAARTELHPIPSLTLSDEQFLKGDT